MSAALFAFLLASAGPETVGDGDAVTTRPEPHLAAGARALAADDPELALERYRKAEATSDTERGIIEYDVGQAIVLRELKVAQAARAPSQNGEPAAPATPPDMSEAMAALERAATLSRDPRLTSEARLAAGNAAMVGGKLDEAIAALRKALIADPSNDRARRNLQRALTMKAAQPPPPPQQGDGDDDKKNDQKDEDKKDGDKQDADKNESDKQDANKKAGDKQDGDKQDGDKQDGDKQDADKQDADKQDGDEQDADKQDTDKDKKDGDETQSKEPAPGDPKKKPTSREEARRLLQGIRARERPLSPMELRGTERRQPPVQGKDW